MRFKLILLSIIAIQLLIVLLIFGWQWFVVVVIATSVLTKFATATPTLLDDPPGEVVIDVSEYTMR